MAPGTIKQVHEMNVNGFLLVQRKKKKEGIFTHFRCIAKASSVTMHTLDERSITVTRDTHGVEQVETRMTNEEKKQFEKDWEEMWKPNAKLFKNPDSDFTG